MKQFLARFICVGLVVAVVLGVLSVFGATTAQAAPAIPAPATQLVSQSQDVSVPAVSVHASPAAMLPNGKYVVEPGNTLSGIAAKLHVPGGWKAIYDMNVAVIGPNPDRIKPGMELVLPSSDNPPVPAPAPAPPAAPASPAPAAPPAQPEAQPAAEWVHPFPEFHRCSSGFGQRWGRLHGGVDLSNRRTGSPVLSIADGTVRHAGGASGYGSVVVIEHANGVFSEYGHVKRRSIKVKVGETVQAGQHIADVGNEGESTGPHLHLTVSVGGYFNNDKKVDPVPFLKERGVRLCHDPR